MRQVISGHFVAKFVPDERLPSSATLHDGDDDDNNEACVCKEDGKRDGQ